MCCCSISQSARPNRRRSRRKTAVIIEPLRILVVHFSLLQPLHISLSLYVYSSPTHKGRKWEKRRSGLHDAAGMFHSSHRKRRRKKIRKRLDIEERKERDGRKSTAYR
jgi:hypothetical protein